MHLLVCELHRFQNARCNDKNYKCPFLRVEQSDFFFFLNAPEVCCDHGNIELNLAVKEFSSSVAKLYMYVCVCVVGLKFQAGSGTITMRLFPCPHTW